MAWLTDFLGPMRDLAIVIATVALASGLLWVADRWLIQRRAHKARHRPLRQLTMIFFSLTALVAVVLSLPMDADVKKELLGLMGIVLTGIIAFSSTTFIANIMAGLMLRSVESFSPGDFIQAGDYFGKVTERGLFHTEIQSEDRDLVTLPNLFLAANPVKVVRSSGTAVSCDLSLGYDVPHQQVEDLLKEAALRAELEDPFVQILTLGDFSITYRAAGFYRNVQHLLSKRSALRAAILDELHGAGIEIVSPTFMNQRKLPDGRKFIPGVRATGARAKEASAIFPETLLFDKANRAQRMEMLESKRVEIQQALKDWPGDADPESPEARAEQKRLQTQLTISESLLAREKEKEPQ